MRLSNEELWWILNGCPSVKDDVGYQGQIEAGERLI